MLAMVRVAWDIAFGSREPDFSEQPFDLGGFDAIAHYQGKRTRRIHEFKIGGEFPMSKRNKGTVRSVTGTFTERTGQPVLSAWTTSQGETDFSVETSDFKEMHVLGKQHGIVLIEEEHPLDYRHRTNLTIDAFMVMQNQLLQIGQSKGKPWLSVDSAMVLFELLPTSPISRCSVTTRSASVICDNDEEPSMT